MDDVDPPSDAVPRASPAEALWSEVQRKYSTRYTFFSLNASLQGMGLSDRLGGRRVEVLQRSKHAQWLMAQLGNLDVFDLQAFKAIAYVNKDQAEAAFRFTAVANFTVPLTLAVVINQILENGLYRFLADSYEGSLALFAVTVFVIAMLMSYVVIMGALSGVRHARDIYHLTMLELAKRKETAVIAEFVDDSIDSLPTDLS
ncbi:MAG: hypothetical protein QNI84_01090 [Henriciella sp.]|nr:hypothetical protein [Henriciella sp.]